MLAGDDLTIVLFFIGTAITLGCTAMSAAGWRHPVLIVSLFFMAGVCFVFGAFWPALKDVTPPSIAAPVHQISASPVSWFVVLILGLTATLLLPRRRALRYQEKPWPQIVKTPSPPVIAVGLLDEEPAAPPPSTEEKIFVDIDPAALIELFRTRTTIQAKALTASHIGKWTSLTSKVQNVSGDFDWLAVQLYDGKAIVSAICSRPVSERAIHFTQEAIVTVTGRIEEIDRISLVLKNCDFS